jgi:hypothetical protein
MLADTTARLGTIRRLRDDGRDQPADELERELVDTGALDAGEVAKRWDKGAKKDRKALNDMAADRQMTGAEKRQHMDALQRAMNTDSRRSLGDALEAMRGARKAAGARP